MKIRAIILSCLLAALILPVGDKHTGAESVTGESRLKIGVVSIRHIFQGCMKSAKYRQEVLAERGRIEAKLQKLAKDIEAGEAGLKTLRTDSSDYLTQVRKILQDRADLQTEQEFYKRRMALIEQRTTEEIYRDILRETSEVAKQKGLHLVLEKSEPELPAANLTRLELAMGAHKVLYSDSSLDITDEVMARVNAEKSKEEGIEGAMAQPGG